ncbi:MAG: type II secretion system protein [Candidatus Omnitrophota bacterium]
MRRLVCIKTCQAFTLIELVIVITILGILGAVAIPVFSNLREKAYESQEVAFMVALQEAVNHSHHRKFLETGNWDASWPQGWPPETAQHPPFFRWAIIGQVFDVLANSPIICQGCVCAPLGSGNDWTETCPNCMWNVGISSIGGISYYHIVCRHAEIFTNKGNEWAYIYSGSDPAYGRAGNFIRNPSWVPDNGGGRTGHQ